MPERWPTQPVPYTNTLIEAGILKAPPSYQSPYTPSNDPRQSNINTRARLAYAGIEAPTEPPETSLFLKIIDVLERPRYAVVGAVKGLTQPGEQGLAQSLTNALSYAWGGLKGEEKHSVGDIMRSYGVKNKLALALGGFLGDVALDPLTYVSPFKSIFKSGVPAAKAADLATDLQKVTGKVAPKVISKDIIYEAVEDVSKQAPKIIERATKSGRKVSALEAALSNALGQAPSPDIAQRTLKALSGGVTPASRAASVQAAEKLSIAKMLRGMPVDEGLKALNKLSPTEVATVKALASEFGDIAGIDIIKGGTELAKGIKKGGLVPQYASALKEATKAADDLVRVKLANGLVANFEKATNRRFLTFMGKPIIETTVVPKTFTKAGKLAYESLGPVRETVDVVRRGFQTSGWPIFKNYTLRSALGAQEAQAALSNGVLPVFIREGLEEIAGQTIREGTALDMAKFFATRTGRAVKALPQSAMVDAVELLGDEIANDKNLARALTYYRERLVTNDGGAAARAWQSIAQTLTPDQLKTIEEASQKVSMYWDMIQKMDEAVGITYTAKLNYVPHVYKVAELSDDAYRRLIERTTDPAAKQLIAALSETTTHALHQEIPSVAWAMEHADFLRQLGFEATDDFRVIATMRIRDTYRNTLLYNLNDVLENLPAGLSSQEARKGWAAITRTAADGSRRTFWVDPEVNQILTRMNNIFTNDLSFKQMTNMWDRATAWIKTLQTTLNIPFHMRNAFGEFSQNLFAGVGIDNYDDAARVLNALKADDVIEIAGQRLSTRSVLRSFYEQGLAFQGMTREGVAGAVAQSIDEALEKTFTANPVKLGRKVSDFTDTYFRMAHYLEGLKRGLTPEAAADWVRQFHVDYDDLTLLERNVMRRMMPYYTFTRKNIPMQVGMLIENPGFFNALVNLTDSAHRAMGSPATSKFLRSNLAIPIYDDGKGNLLFLNWNLPVADLGRFQTNIADTMQEFTGMLHPFIRVPIELGANRKLTTGQPIVRPGKEWQPIGAGPLENISLPSRLIYVLDQTLGAPWAARRSFGEPGEGEEEVLKTPRQIPLMQSMLPVKSKAQMAAAREYELRELLNEIRARAEAQGTFVPTTTELKRMRRR